MKIRHSFVAALCTLLCIALSPLTADAKPKDGQATKLYDQALDEDYLNTDFDAAIKKLNKGIQLCGKSKCSAKVLGKLHVGLGTIYGGGKSDMGRAKASFMAAFEVDKNAQPLEDFMTEELQAVFKKAKAASASSGGSSDKPGGSEEPSGTASEAAGDIDYAPPAEALVNTPLPVYVTVPSDVGVEQVKLRYKPFGGIKWLGVKLAPLGEGFGVMIPCAQITTTGKLRLYIIMKDSEGDPIATAGTLKQPHEIQIKNKIDGDQPALPGQEPPKKCQVKADCPPGFPGCGSSGGGSSDEAKGSGKKKRGTKGWGATCEASKECQAGFICLNGSCEMGEDDSDDDDDSSDGSDDGSPKNYASLGIQLDILALSGAENVCGYVNSSGEYKQEHDNFFCYTDDGEFLGKPAKDKFNEVVGGGALAGARLLVGYDRVLWKGLLAGARIGYAFGGSPDVGSAADRQEECKDNDQASGCRATNASNFLPFHGELRASYMFPKMVGGLIRPYGFLGGGLGQVSAGVPVAVCDTVRSGGDNTGEPFASTQKCKGQAGAKQREVEAYQITGLNFIDLGGGAIFNVYKNWGVNVEAKFMIMLPTMGFVFAPSVAPVFMF